MHTWQTPRRDCSGELLAGIRVPMPKRVPIAYKMTLFCISPVSIATLRVLLVLISMSCASDT